MISREGSSNINLDESLISGSDSNVTVKEEENHLNDNNRFATGNRKARKKYEQRLNRTKGTVTTIKSNNLLTQDKQQGNENVKSYAEAVKYNRMNISSNAVILSEIYNQLPEDKSKNTSKVEISPPKVCTNSASSSSASDSKVIEINPTISSSQDEEIISVLEEL